MKAGDSVAVFAVPEPEKCGRKSNFGGKFKNNLVKGKLYTKGDTFNAYKMGEKTLGVAHSCGTWSKYAVIDAAACVKLDSVEPWMASYGYALASGLMCPEKLFQVEIGSTCAVFGTSSVGLLTAMALIKKKCKVAFVGVDEEGLKLADDLGCHTVKFTDDAEMRKALLAIAPDAYDYTFVCDSFD